MHNTRANRLGKDLPVDNDVLGRSLIPDISGQIVFVPSNVISYRTYIPLRLKGEPKHNNSSRSFLSIPVTSTTVRSALSPT